MFTLLEHWHNAPWSIVPAQGKMAACVYTTGTMLREGEPHCLDACARRLVDARRIAMASASFREEEAWWSAILAAEAYKLVHESEDEPREWSKPWWKSRTEEGSYTKLFQELQNDPAAFKANFRVTPTIFNFIPTPIYSKYLKTLRRDVAQEFSSSARAMGTNRSVVWEGAVAGNCPQRGLLKRRPWAPSIKDALA